MKNPAAILIALVVLLVLVFGSLFVVSEYEQAVVTRFQKPVRTVPEPGLHLKIPVIERVLRFDKRILEWDGYPEQIPTNDNKYIYLDTMARWRIVDPLLFLQSLRDERRAQSRLDDIIDAAARDMVASHVLIDAVRTSDRILEIPQEDSRFELDPEQVGKISVGREELARKILENARVLVAAMGIELLDVRIKRINYIESVRQKVYDRMISGQKRIAARYRSEGEGKHAEIVGGMNRELKKITSEAYREAQEIKGKADGKATRIYASAYNRAPEFYSFLQTLESYRTTIKGNSRLILTTDSDFYKYLKSAKP